MIVEAGKYYECENGGKAYAGYVREDGIMVGHAVHVSGGVEYRSLCSWHMDGRVDGVNTSLNLVAEWVEPKPVEVWLNVFTTGTRSLTLWTRDSALSVAEEALFTIGLRLWPDRDPEVIERIVHGEGSDGRRR